jgi:hypothetical protein
MRPYVNSFAHAFVRSSAGIVAVIVVPKAIRLGKRAIAQVRPAAAGAADLEARMWLQALKGARWMGAGAEARADRLKNGRKRP